MFECGFVNRTQNVVTKKVIKRTEINKADGYDETRKMSALIRFHLGIDASNLSDFEFAKIWNDLKFALNFENERMSMSAGLENVKK